MTWTSTRVCLRSNPTLTNIPPSRIYAYTRRLLLPCIQMTHFTIFSFRSPNGEKGPEFWNLRHNAISDGFLQNVGKFFTITWAEEGATEDIQKHEIQIDQYDSLRWPLFHCILSYVSSNFLTPFLFLFGGEGRTHSKSLIVKRSYNWKRLSHDLEVPCFKYAIDNVLTQNPSIFRCSFINRLYRMTIRIQDLSLISDSGRRHWRTRSRNGPGWDPGLTAHNKAISGQDHVNSGQEQRTNSAAATS
jgi:hypothetical protein